MMFVILTYDVQAARVAKARKVAEKYLQPVQNSVFEGHLTEARLKQLKHELRQLLDLQRDSVVLYRQDPYSGLQREHLGKHQWADDLIL